MSQSPVIPWQTRSDLQVIDLGGEREKTYAVKDVVSDEYFRFGEIEYHILQSLKGTFTLDGLRQAVASRFGFVPGTGEVIAYLNQLASDNLLVANGLGDGDRLFRQHEKARSGGIANAALGLLSIKLPGFYPGPLLSWLQPLGSLLFNPLSVATGVVAFVATLLFAVFSWQSLAERAPAITELLSVEHLFLMAIGFAVAKLFHEIGHGLACRQVGHECSEMGVLLLVMIPCLYCDVSDLWTQRSRYKRMLVSLAGVFVELALATVCFWGWYFSLEGTMNRFLFSMMLVTSVNTLFVNGNPLMKYDGYYALSDLTGIHNLASSAQRCLGRVIDGFFFKTEPLVSLYQRSTWLKTYAAASFVYRWIVLSAIGWMAWTFFENQGLMAFGRLAVGALLVIAILPLLLSLSRFWNQGKRYGLRWINTLLFFALIGAAAWAADHFEFEHRVSGRATIQLVGAKQIFAPDSGLVVALVSDGQEVDSGQPIAEIVNDELLLERLVAKEQLNDATARLDALQLSEESTAAADIEFWNQRQASWQRKLDDTNDQISRLTVVAPRKGIFVAQQLPRTEMDVAEERLVALDGSWIHPQHRGGSVKRGENLGYVADRELFMGQMQVEEKDVELVEKDREVRIFLPFERRYLVGKVTKIAVESESAAGTESQASQAQSESFRFYRVEFQFPYDSRVRIGSSRKAVILGRKTNLIQWTRRWIHSTFWL